MSNTGHYVTGGNVELSGNYPPAKSSSPTKKTGTKKAGGAYAPAPGSYAPPPSGSSSGSAPGPSGDVSYPVLEASGWASVDPMEINALQKREGHKHRYAITGDESQIVTVSIPPGESCQGEPGSMMYLTSPIDMKASCGGDCLGRCLGGESCCVLNFNNRTSEKGYAALVANSPLAKIVPVDMGSKDVGGNLIVQQGAYVASYGDVHITFDCDCNLVRCCCGGMVSSASIA